MQFFIDAQGTTHNLISSPIYQNSTYSNELVLVAPFSASNVVVADFELPIGISTTPYLMSLSGTPMNMNGVTYNVWRVLLDGVITQYPGKVTVQFEIYQNGYKVEKSYKTIKLATYASTFAVERGVTPQLPDTPSANIYEQILAYMANLDPQYNIKSMSYSAPGYEIDTDTDVESVLGVPNGVTQKDETDFSKENIDGSESRFFFFCDENTEENTGFTIVFNEEKRIGKMQLNICRAYYQTELDIKATDAGGKNIDITSLRICAPSDEIVSYVVEVGQAVKSISVIQPYDENVVIDQNTGLDDLGFTNGRFAITSIEFWEPNIYGYLSIKSATNRIITIPSTDQSVIVESEQNAAKSASNAQAALDEINNKAGKVGGYPILENIGGSPKIPSVYINLVNPTIYVPITDISQLETLVADVSTVAVLTVDIDGETGQKEVKQSFVKLQEGVGADKWALYATSYADNASNALYAGQATNALTVNGVMIKGVSEAEYNALISKQGVYFVTLSEPPIEG